MALQGSTIFFEAIFMLLASTLHTCSAVGPAQAFVGADGALTQTEPSSPLAAPAPLARTGASAQPGVASVVVDAQGNSAPASELAAPALLAGGDGQQLRPGPYQAQTYQGNTYRQPVHAAYPSAVPAAYPAAVPVPAGASPPIQPPLIPRPQPRPTCLVPMWAEEEYVCKEHEDFERNSFMDSLRRVRISMPDGTTCTVKPPGKWSFWMASEVTEMTCKAGVWVDGKSRPVTEIEMKTALWFLIASAVTVGVLVYILYKSYYDPESSFYAWRLSWSKAPPPAEEAGSDATQAATPGVNISISNASGGQPAPAPAQPR